MKISAQYAIWVLSPIILLTVAYIMQRSEQRQSFPWFFLYLLWVAASSYARLAIHFAHHPLFDFYSYWANQAIAIGLSFVVLYELCKYVLTSGTLPISKSTFVLLNAVLLIGAAVMGLMLPVGENNQTIYTILVLTRTARVVQVGLMLILIALSLFFGFYWSSQAFGIAAGFGFYATVELVNYSIRAMLGKAGNFYWGWVSVLSYQCAAVLWLIYAIKGRRLPQMELPKNKEISSLSR